MSGQYSHNRADLVDELTQKSVTVTTSATELFTGGSRNASRQYVRIYNDGGEVCYVGPVGVTSSGSTKGEPLEKKQWMSIEIGNVALYAITDSSTSVLIVTELA